LVRRVCSGEVGAIFGIEISRLARSSAEVARLMEFAAITETLLIDADGVYDPCDVNDRMLLGLKGTMGEVELHVMAQRLRASKRAAAARGELRTPLPVGLCHDELGEVIVDPDARGPGRDLRLFAAFAAWWFGLRGGRRVRRSAVPAARLRRRLGGAIALGCTDSPPGCWACCATAAMPGRTCTAGMPPAVGSIPTAPCTRDCSSGPAPSGRC